VQFEFFFALSIKFVVFGLWLRIKLVGTDVLEEPSTSVIKKHEIYPADVFLPGHTSSLSKDRKLSSR
jgi:hypothetical protein